MKISLQWLGCFLGIFLTKNIIGAMLGFFLGNMLERNLYSIRKVQSSIFKSPLTRQDLFTQTTFATFGHIAKAKGRVTSEDIELANILMNQYKLDNYSKKLAINAFNLGKAQNFLLRVAIREFRDNCNDRKLIKMFLDIQLQAAFIDNHISENEQQILSIIAEELGISAMQLQQMIMFMQVMSQFNATGSYANFEQAGYSQYNSNQYQQYQQYNNGAKLEDAYTILGVSRDDDRNTVKKAYRKLMNEYHPDKLVSKGLPPEMMEVAKQKAQKIQAAYDLVCKQNGWK